MLWMQWVSNKSLLNDREKNNNLLMKEWDPWNVVCCLPVNLLTLTRRKVNMWNHQISWSEERLQISWKLLWDAKVMSEVNKSWAFHADIISKCCFIERGKPQDKLRRSTWKKKNSFLKDECFICCNCLHLYLLMSHFLSLIGSVF